MTETLQRTTRREAREGYARFLLAQTGLADSDIDEFMSAKQAVLEGKSPLELIYTGDYKRAVSAVETFTEDLILEEHE